MTLTIKFICIQILCVNYFDINYAICHKFVSHLLLERVLECSAGIYCIILVKCQMVLIGNLWLDTQREVP